MRINVPCLPIVVEVRWRRLPPFRFTLRGLMIGIAVAALLCALIVELGHANRASRHHSAQAALAAEARILSGIGPPGPPSKLESWHSAMATDHRRTFERLDILIFIAILTLASLAVVTALGRLLDRSSWRLRGMTGDEATDSRSIPPDNLEDPRP